MIDPNSASQLRQKFQQGNVTLFLGAGTSVGNGLPDWKKLVTSIYFGYMVREQWQRVKPYPNYLYALSQWYIDKTGDSLDIVVRKIKSGCDDQLFRELLWESLYSTYIDNKLLYSQGVRSPLLNSITNLIKAPEKVRYVITYNFDDLLEDALNQAGHPNYKTVYTDGYNETTGTLPIFHVHGYVPFNGNQDAKKVKGEVILSEEDYNGIANNPIHWANMKQLRSFMATTNIMIGLSLKDRNLRRILDMTSRHSASSQNYIFLQRNPPPTLAPDDFAHIDKEARKLMEAWQENPYIKTNDGLQVALPNILNHLHSYHTDTEAKVFADLKITPIWYDDHREIPDLLNSLV